MQPPALLALSGICKRYRVAVLKNVDLRLEPGEVHGLIGANGAGKTTLCNVICGLVRNDAGTMAMDGREYSPQSVNDASGAGIRLVKQEPGLIGNLTVAENLFLPDLPHRHGFVSFGAMYPAASAALNAVGLDGVHPGNSAANLGLGEQQLVEIARALMRPCRLLILDEPTAALSSPQVERLFDKIGELRAAGAAILYISHRMDEFRRIADKITILRDGAVALTAKADVLSDDEIVRQMVGSSASAGAAQIPRKRGPIAVEVENVGRAGALHDINLRIFSGEILGIAGLIGSGRTELLRAIFGADTPDHGCLRIGPESRTVHLASPAEAVRHGIGLVPEDRKREGLLLSQSIVTNTTLAALAQFSQFPGRIDRRREVLATSELGAKLSIDYNSPEQPVGELSGGNQQKITIARWLLCECTVLLLDEPSRGVDVAAREAIHQLLRELASAGKAVVVVSSETEELMALCNRIAVMSRGRIAAEFAAGEWTDQLLMAAQLNRENSVTDGAVT